MFTSLRRVHIKTASIYTPFTVDQSFVSTMSNIMIINIVKRSRGESRNSCMSLAIALNYFLLNDAHELHPFEYSPDLFIRASLSFCQHYRTTIDYQTMCIYIYIYVLPSDSDKYHHNTCV